MFKLNMSTQQFNYNNLMKNIESFKNKQYVLLGESTHGTEEFYLLRLIITQILVEKYNYNTVLFETEWSIGYQLNLFIHSQIEGNIKTILNNVSQSYPKWMINNEYIMKLLLFLKQWNLTHKKKVYFYGVDCQDIDLAYQNVCDDKTMNCFIIKKLIMNYKKMNQSGNYWNDRDTFWKYIIDQIKNERDSKFILWAHNSHIGNCKADPKNDHKINIGYLLDRTYQSFKIGFSSYEGTVKASKKWNGPGRKYKLLKAHKDSYEYLFHKICEEQNTNSLIYISDSKLKMNKLFRYVGVVYDTKNEMSSHYSVTDINKEFNILIFVDVTNYLKQSTKLKNIKAMKMSSLKKIIENI